MTLRWAASQHGELGELGESQPEVSQSPYLRLKVRPQLPQRISPGLYPPIENLVRQFGQVTV